MRFRSKLAAVALAALTCFTFVACSGRNGTPDIPPHLITVPDETPVRPVDSRESVTLKGAGGLRECVDELYSAVVYDKKRPIFGDDDPAEPVYDAARAVLDRYVLNAWHTSDDGEYNKVHAIHDYLVRYVEYDFELYDDYTDGATELGDDPAFYIDGALLGGKAVCDGLSRAFEFLCALEGLDVLRVTGSLASVPHAWNKVKVNGVWYNVDVTADAAHYTVGGGKYEKQLSHGYFLLSDKTISEFKPQTHVFSEQPFIASVDHDYYADKTVTVGGTELSAIVRSADELTALFKAVKQAKNEIGKLEVKLEYPDKVQVNSVDMYATDIKSAYTAIGGGDFGYSSGNAPYFRYPNGVYLFLFYK